MSKYFKLRKGKKVNTILLDYRIGRSIRVRCSTNLTFDKNSEKYWDKNIGEIKSPNDIFGYQDINDKLYDYKKKINAAVYDLNQNQMLTQEQCDYVIKKIINGEKTNIKKTENLKQSKSDKDSIFVLDFFKWFTEFYANNNSPYTKSKMTSGTVRTYKNCRSYLEKYLKARKIKKLTFNDVDQDFYHDFINYGQEKGYSRNYIGSMIQKLKTIINAAYENGNHNNREHTKRYFSKLKEEVNHPYLNEEELESISKLELEDQLYCDVRDVFILNAYTGLRVGDLTTFLKNPKVIEQDGKRFIHLKQKKTGGEVYIPLNSKIKSILEKRDGNFPPYVRANLINKSIKEIAKEAEINQPFTIEKTIGGKKTKITKAKYDLITAHTARRSFCTNAYNAGMKPHEIMIISGHKSERVFYTYIKADVLTKAKQASKHPFFD